MHRLAPRAAALALACAATPAAAEWREASTDHFLIYADSSEKWTREFAERLERGAAAMERLQPEVDRSASKSNRVVIYAVSSIDAVQKLCGRCGSVAGFYIPRVGHSIAYTPRSAASGEWDMSSDIALFHEYGHHYMLSSARVAYPKWYSEGMAEFLSTMRVASDGTVEIGRPAKHRAYNILNAAMPIEQLIGSTGRSDDLSQDIFYGRSWMLTHMLLFDPSRRGQTEKYLTALNAGTPNLDAARAAFGDLRQLNKDLNAYVGKPIRYVRMPAAIVKSGSVAVRLLTPGEAAMMPIRMKSDRGVSNKEALALVPDARRRIAPFPNDPGAQVSMAEVEYDAGNDVEAEAAADRALAVDPKNVEALLYKGRVRVRRAAKATTPDAAAWKDARSWYVKANRVDPDAAEPLLLYYMSFAEAGDAPTKNAALGLYRALELSPQDPGLRMTAAFQYLNDRDLPRARRTLLPLAYAPHIPADKNFAARLVAMIDAKASVDDILKSAPKDADADTES